FSICRCRRRENDGSDIKLGHYLQQHLCTVNIIIKIVEWFFHGFTYKGVRSKMNHSVDVFFFKNTSEKINVSDISFIKGRFRMNRFSVASLQVINDDDIFLIVDELINSVGTDISSTT